jgi:CheY-like chemotaxis protein
MDAATQRRLFMPFSQADESTTRRFGGTGLGLSICRELARLLGGEVGVHSVLGEGSRFWAELPLAPAAPTHAGPRADGADLARLRHARVLMVEDNPVNMLIAVAQLEQWGAMVDQAHDGQAAVEAVERAANEGRPFDVVLMDLQMPQMGGNDAARALRRRFTPQELPIIALTAAALVSERQRALQAGMNDFVSKPIDPDQLLRALGKALASGSERPVLDTH